jgi:hypothetical protein
MKSFFGQSLLAVALLLALVAPSSALAQEEGVTVDPGSPAEKEYAIPLVKERRDASESGPKRRVRKNDRSAPLFGAGVEPESTPSGSGSGSGSSETSADNDSSQEEESAAGTSGSTRERRPSSTEATGSRDDDDGSLETASADSRANEQGLTERDRERVSTLAADTTADAPLGSTALVVGGTGVLLVAAILGGIGLRRRRPTG